MRDERLSGGRRQCDDRETGGECLEIRGNVAETGDVERIVGEVGAAWGGLDIVVSNAATGPRATSDRATTARSTTVPSKQTNAKRHRGSNMPLPSCLGTLGPRHRSHHCADGRCARPIPTVDVRIDLIPIDPLERSPRPWPGAVRA